MLSYLLQSRPNWLDCFQQRCPMCPQLLVAAQADALCLTTAMIAYYGYSSTTHVSTGQHTWCLHHCL
jgi:hypothetical protein